MKFFKKLLHHTGVLIGLCVMAAMVIVLHAAVLKPAADRQSESFAVTEDTPLSPVQATDSDNAQTLARVFEDAVPTLNAQSMTGLLRNTTFEGQQARILTMQYEQCTVLCVRPVTAAPILLQSSLDLQFDTDLSVLSLPATYATDGATHCLYFSGETTAYAFIASGMPKDDFLTLAGELTFVR